MDHNGENQPNHPPAANFASPAEVVHPEDMGGQFSDVSSPAYFSVLASWAVISFCVVFLAGSVAYSQFYDEPEPVESIPAQANIGLRTAIGMKEVIELIGGAAGEAADVEVLNKGPVAQRVAYVIGKAEQDGFESAAQALQLVRKEMSDAKYEPTELEIKLLNATQHIIDSQRLKERDKQIQVEETTAEAVAPETAGSETAGSETAGSETNASTAEASDEGSGGKAAGQSSSDEASDEAEVSQIPEPVAVSDEVLAGDLKLAQEKLGIAGELANAWASNDPVDLQNLKTRMRNSTIGISIFGVAVMFAGLLGFVLLAVLIGLALAGQIQPLMVAPGQASHVYLEAFAVWIAGFVGFQLFVPLALMIVEVDLKNDHLAANVATVVIFYTPMLVGVAWMWIRHPSPGRALREAGFQTHGFFSDIGHGLVTYLAFLPAIALSMGLTVLLTSLVWGGHEALHPFAPEPGPSHPIQNEANGTLWTTLFLYFVAAISAPIVEEIVFRGLLFRWLRDVSVDLGVWGSCLMAAAINSLIFASIHPQGLLGIPPLMTIGFCMSLARHWRGGLVAPMTIHAVHNGSLVTMLTILNL